MESDRERLAILGAFSDLGSVTASYGEANRPLEGLFDRDASDLSLGDLDVASRAPVFLCLESDAIRLSIARDAPLLIPGDGSFAVGKRIDRPADLGPGFTRLVLKRI
jgi:hypothetical protein